MTSIEVVAHGDRWAVRVGGDTRSEHLTREEAGLEARRLGDATPSIREDDPSGLAARQDDTDPAGGPDAGPSGVSPGELPRESQTGL